MEKSQTGTPRFNVFTDGSQGGEAEMVRRMRIGQLQAALLSVVGLREIEPSIAALQTCHWLSGLGKSWTTYAKRCAQAWKRNS